MKTQLYYTIEVRDREGKLLKRLKRKAHSYLKAYNQILYNHYSSASQSVKDTGGTDRSIARNASDFVSGAAIGNDDRGIIIGTGTTAVTISDYQVETKIDEGTASGQMEYQVVTVTAPSVSGSSISFTVKRTTTNNSGATITVKETAIYCYGGGTTYHFCIVRDVLVSTVDVPDGGSITVTYTMEHTV